MAGAERGIQGEQSHGNRAGRLLLVAAAAGGLYLGFDLTAQASADTGTTAGTTQDGGAPGVHGGQEAAHGAPQRSSSLEQTGATSTDAAQTQHTQTEGNEGAAPTQAVPERPQSGSFGGHTSSGGKSAARGHGSAVPAAAEGTAAQSEKGFGATTTTTATAQSSGRVGATVSASTPDAGTSRAPDAAPPAGNEHAGSRHNTPEQPAGAESAPVTGPAPAPAPESVPPSSVTDSLALVPPRPAPAAAAAGAAPSSEHAPVEQVSAVDKKDPAAPAGTPSDHSGGAAPAHGQRSDSAPKHDRAPAQPVPPRPTPTGHTDPTPATVPVTTPQPASSPTAGHEMAGDVVYYNQHDQPWANHRYDGGSGTGDIDENGCGATTLAEAITTLAGRDVTPIQVADDLMASKEVTYDGSTAWAAIINEPRRYGLRTEAFTNLHIIPDLRHTIEEGGVIAINGTDKHPDPSTPATTGGHFYLIREITPDNKFYIADPNSRENSQKPFTADQILGPATFAAEILPATPPAAPAPSPQPAPGAGSEQTADHGHPDGTTPLPDSYTGSIPVPSRPQPAGTGHDRRTVPPRPLPAGVPAPAPASVPAPTPESTPAPLSDHDRIIQATQQLINRGGEWAVRGAVLRHFLSEGYTPAHAAALDGNFMAESSDNPASNQEGHGPGRGLGQWEEGAPDGRFDSSPVNLVDFASSEGKPWTDLEVQLDFVDKELHTSETHAYEKIHATTTPKDGALAVSRYYERPNPASAHNDRRQAYAQEDYDAYTAALASLNG